MSRVSQGIITGCDANQEWMLAWWWGCLRKHNNYPVCFIDFGMSEAARKWCEARGEVITLPELSFQISSEKDIDPLRTEQWNQRIGKAIWRVRTAWFKKPFAILCSPFEHGLWLDLDCEVRGSLDLIFNYLWLGATLVMRPETESEHMLQCRLGELQKREIIYNSGVMGFRSDAPILHSWSEEVRLRNDLYHGDQLALSRAIWKTSYSVIHLLNTYNWFPEEGKFQDAVIVHYAGGINKLLLMGRVINSGFTLRLDEEKV